MFRVLLLGLIRLVAKPGFELRGGGGQNLRIKYV